MKPLNFKKEKNHDPSSTKKLNKSQSSCLVKNASISPSSNIPENSQVSSNNGMGDSINCAPLANNQSFGRGTTSSIDQSTNNLTTSLVSNSGMKHSQMLSTQNKQKTSQRGDNREKSRISASVEKSDTFQMCYDALNNFHNLNPKEKRKVGNDFISLMDDNMNEASELFFEFIELFDSDLKLKSSKEEFELSYKGDLNKMKVQKLLPMKLGQLKSMLEMSSAKINSAQKEIAQLFTEIFQMDPKQAYELFNSFKEVIEKYQMLMAVKDQYWNDMNKHIEPFIVKGNYTLLETINNIEVYKKGTETFDPSEILHVRNLLVVGETGSGKSTLLNSMTTYLVGINYFDSVRVKTIVENSRVSQSHTQTLQVTEYYVKPDPKRFPYPIRFIDTPGFGDTRGLEYDQQNAQLIWKYIQQKRINIHGICFVMKATTNRMTCIQQYIIQQVLGLFGREVDENFIGMITFADNQTTLAVKALQDAKVPVKKIFKFNNSGFFPSKTRDEDNALNQLYWEMGMQNFNQFFAYLLTITPASLGLTKQCIKVRETLELKIKTIKDKIADAINERKNLEKQYKIFKKNQDKINSNKNFTYEEYCTESIQCNKPPGQYTTNCMRCNMTCHQDCVYKEEKDKWGCTAMKDFFCTVCPGKCEWTAHQSLGCYVEKQEKKITVSWDNVKKNFMKGVKGIKLAEGILFDIEGKIQKVSNNIISDIKEYLVNLELLYWISRQKFEGDVPGYLNMMIQIEEKEKKEGYKDRIRQIEGIKWQFKAMPKSSYPPAIFTTAEIKQLIKDVETQQQAVYKKNLFG